MTGVRRAAFLDRDGVINEERAFVHTVEEFAWVPGTVEALRHLKAAGYLLVIITNQSGIARGLYTEADYVALTQHMQNELAVHGVHLDAIDHCPHLPDAPVPRYRLDCECRKPRPGMIERICRTLDVDVSASILVGDRLSDIEAGRRAGVGRCFLVRSGQALDAAAEMMADGVYANLATCVDAAVPISKSGTADR
jgi:D-glycero-D-manno-heptose 1,7-bisphosphate phosphatase